MKNKLVNKEITHDFELYKQVQLRECIKNIINDKKLLPEQKDVLKEYYNFMASGGSKAKSDVTIQTKLSTISLFAREVRKPFNQVTKEDTIRLFSTLKLERNYKNNTIAQAQTVIRIFYKWLYGTKDYPEVVAWMKPKFSKNDIKEEELLTKDDVLQMVKVCDRVRDKAFCMILYDSGCRISELLGLKIKNVIIDQYGAKISVKGKTGYRSIRLIDSVPFLTAWINEHPFNTNPESPLFISLRRGFGEPLKYVGIKDLLSRINKRAKIIKKINPHNWRHSKVNAMCYEGFNERDLCIIFGWATNSKMPSRYTHYQEKEVEEKLLRKRGLLIEDKKEIEDKILEPKKCPRCNKINLATSLYCNCGMALDIKQVMKDIERREQADNEMNELFVDVEFRELLKDYLKKKQQQN